MEGGREECNCGRKKKTFFSPFLCKVSELKGGVLEAGRESGRSVDTVKFVCLLDILFLSLLCMLGRVWLQRDFFKAVCNVK